MTLFLDITSLSERATDDALEFIYKSTPEGGEGIWRKHESVLIRRLIELFTRRGLDRLDHVKAQILEWEAGAHYRDGMMPMARPGMMARWTRDELGLVRIYLESLFPGAWTIDDHMMMVDYVVQRYLPEDELRTEAEWLSTRASLMGKVQANMDAVASVNQADLILAALPSTTGSAVSQFNLPAQQKAALEFARVRCAESVRSITESVRHRMRTSILDHLTQQQAVASGSPGQSLQTRLLDDFATLNKDWRRIAITEAGNAQLEGFVASVKPGTKVRRVEQYEDACGFCRGIHDVIAVVVSADHPNKDPDSMIWPTKNNVGRAASPNKRVGNLLVPRSAEELWWLPAGLAHPNCRGRWVPVLEAAPGDDPEFAKWLAETLGES